jgi:hypothetical protein
MRKAILVDIDGTLSDSSHRQHFMEGKKNWKAFYDGLVKDKPHKWCAKLIEWADGFEYHVVLVSGRPDDYRDKTVQWLTEHKITYDALFMRKAGDFRTDFVIKKEIYDASIKETYEILFCVDDRKQVVDMWRSIGLTCLQCAEGDF